MRLCPRVRKGWVLVSEEDRKLVARSSPGPSLKEKRSALSLVSFLAATAEFQPLLPQVFLSNEHLLTEQEVNTLNATSEENTFFIRRKSGWVNNVVLVQILELLAASLGSVLETHRVVLSMDTYKAHLHLDVVRACSRLGLFLYFIPASLTKFLQPLDLLVFKKYKDWISTEIEKVRVVAPAGKLTKEQVFSVCAAGVRAVMEGEPWGRAFEIAGLDGQTGASAELLKRLGCIGPVSVAATLPSAVDLLAVYPRRSKIPIDELFALALRTAPVAARPLLVLPKRARLTVKTRPPPPLPPPAGQ